MNNLGLFVDTIAAAVVQENPQKEAIKNANESGNFVILDEAYRGIAFESIPKFEGALRVRSFSKEFNMENWRLGYLVAPKEIVQKVVKFNQ